MQLANWLAEQQLGSLCSIDEAIIDAFRRDAVANAARFLAGALSVDAAPLLSAPTGTAAAAAAIRR
jgi:hypothetical protein